MIHLVSKFEQPWRTEAYIAAELAKHRPITRWDWASGEFPRKVAPGDVILTSIPAILPHSQVVAWKSQGAKLVAWIFDWIWALGRREAAYLPNLKLFDLVFSTDGFNSSRWDKHGIPRRYLSQAAPREERLLASCDCRHDISFVGSVYTDARRLLLGQLRREFRVWHYEGKPRIWGERLARCYRASRVALGENYRNDIPGYWSSRVYLALATGSFLITPRVEGLDQSFTDGEHLVMYNGTYDDLAVKLRHWLPLEEERRKIGLAGYEHTMKHHTYANRVRELIVVLEGKGIL